jgi:uncharacterized caspase-like protein
MQWEANMRLSAVFALGTLLCVTSCGGGGGSSPGSSNANSASPSLPPAAEERRIALVIGNGGYRHVSPLANPPNDARLTANTLRSVGFQLIGDNALLNADRAAMERAIRDFGKRLRGGTVGLFYYAGHGVQMEGENYLVPVTADVEDAADVKYELISVEYVLDEMKNAGNRLNIVVLDACRNNPFGGRGLRALTRGLAVMQAPAGTIISYATQPGNTATDGTGENSPFTKALTTAMKKPGLSVFDTFNEVGLAVKAATDGQQQPWVANSPIEGSFQFRAALSAPTAAHPATAAGSAPSAAAGTAAAGPSAAEDRAFWESVRDSKSSTELNAYLKQFPNGIYADLARARLASLKAAAAKTQASAGLVNVAPQQRAEAPQSVTPVGSGGTNAVQAANSSFVRYGCQMSWVGWSEQLSKELWRWRGHRDFFVGDDGPGGLNPKKMTNARRAMSVPNTETIVAQVDGTSFGSAVNGVVFTDRRIYYRNLAGEKDVDGRLTYPELLGLDVTVVKHLLYSDVGLGKDHYIYLGASSVSGSELASILQDVQRAVRTRCAPETPSARK